MTKGRGVALFTSEIKLSDSGVQPMSEEETQSTNPSAPVEEIRKSSPLMETIKAFNLTTFAGIALLLIFGFCMMFTTLYVRWWLMIPLAAAGAWKRGQSGHHGAGLPPVSDAERTESGASTASERGNYEQAGSNFE